MVDRLILTHTKKSKSVDSHFIINMIVLHMFLMDMLLPYFASYLNKKDLDNTTDTKGTGLNIFHVEN